MVDVALLEHHVVDDSPAALAELLQLVGGQFLTGETEPMVRHAVHPVHCRCSQPERGNGDGTNCVVCDRIGQDERGGDRSGHTDDQQCPEVPPMLAEHLSSALPNLTTRVRAGALPVRQFSSAAGGPHSVA